MTLGRAKVSQLWKVKTGTRLSLKLAREQARLFVSTSPPTIPTLPYLPTPLCTNTERWKFQTYSFHSLAFPHSCIKLRSDWAIFHKTFCQWEFFVKQIFQVQKREYRIQDSLDSNYGKGQESRQPSTHLQFWFLHPHHHIMHTSKLHVWLFKSNFSTLSNNRIFFSDA